MEEMQVNCDKLINEDGVIDRHIKEVKTCRKAMDEVIGMMRTCCGGMSEQMKTAIMNAQQAQMWCGMELKRLHEMGYGQNPYPNSKDPSNTTIEPTADGLKM